MSRSKDSPFTTYVPWVEFSWVVITRVPSGRRRSLSGVPPTVVETGNTWKSGVTTRLEPEEAAGSGTLGAVAHPARRVFGKPSVVKWICRWAGGGHCDHIGIRAGRRADHARPSRAGHLHPRPDHGPAAGRALRPHQRRGAATS